MTIYLFSVGMVICMYPLGHFHI